MATIGFTLTFRAWNLIAPMSADYKDRLGLNSFQQSLLVAVPVLVGSLGRIPVGALTDKYGARLAVGFLLGLGGTTFAIGIPLVNSWFRPAEHGDNLPFLVVAAALVVYAALAALLVGDRPGRQVPTDSTAGRPAGGGEQAAGHL